MSISSHQGFCSRNVDTLDWFVCFLGTQGRSMTNVLTMYNNAISTNKTTVHYDAHFATTQARGAAFLLLPIRLGRNSCLDSVHKEVVGLEAKLSPPCHAK